MKRWEIEPLNISTPPFHVLYVFTEYILLVHDLINLLEKK